MNNKKQAIAYLVTVAYCLVLIVLFGAIFCETMILYPNIFHDVPHSLEVAGDFMVITGPGDFFPPMGMTSMLLGLASLLLVWRMKNIRNRILVSLLLIFGGEFLFSMFYFWPRNTIMFSEGSALHPDSYLQQTAREFQSGHWLRVVISGIAAGIAFAAFLRFYTQKIKNECLSETIVSEERGKALISN